MKVFVAGAGGFIGSRLVEFLGELGHEVAFHVRSESGDLTENSIPEDTRVVVNSAGRLGGKDADLSELKLANASLPVMLADRCSRTGAHLIHLSTPGVTGLAADADEEMEYDPRGDYERTKAQGEQAILTHSIMAEGLLTVLRPDFVYGPGDLHKLPLFRHVAGGFMPVIGREGARIRPTYRDDVCRAVEASLPGGRLCGGLFNIAGPETVTVRGLSLMIADAIGRKVRILPLPKVVFRLALLLGPLCPSSLSQSRLRLFGDDHFVSIKKAESVSFSPVWTLRKGLDATVSWYLRNGLIR
ncbi:MAG: NAD-dependent epimerase/dehydratase family protein [Candidatus Fermentibacteraceae bacterium]|nr:NAD-dependent epimerase/dehydratase family protein [Candidatus Fermentibacteraceae bacterium]MBN2608357.1 NAD-dependent epimerase/dehydratase family protein [Candidatus Fermentibacteraceae bacterium]